MINAVSSLSTTNTQPRPITPMTPTTPNVPPAASALPKTPIMPTTFTPPANKPDLRENKTTLDLEKSTVAGFASGNSIGLSNGSGTHPKKKNISMIVGIVVFLLLLVGGGIGLYLSSNKQDIRQQASTGPYTIACGSSCSSNTDCNNDNSCHVGKCVLTACLTAGTSCDASMCTLVNNPGASPVASPIPSASPVSSAVCSLAFSVAPAAKLGYSTANCTGVFGWACDGQNFRTPLEIHGYLDTYDEAHLIPVSAIANSTVGADVTSLCGGVATHNFVFNYPVGFIPPGQHTILVYASGLNANGVSDNTLQYQIGTIASGTITCQGSPTPSPVISPIPSPIVTSATCEKVAYQDELSNSAGHYTLSTPKSNFQPGDIVVFKLTLTNTGAVGGTAEFLDPLLDSAASNLGKVTFLDSDCGATAYDSTKNTLTCSTSGVAIGASVTHIFRVKIARTIADGTVIVNTCQAGLTTGSNQCQVDTDCTSGQSCYHPPMPACPTGVSCIQSLPPTYCTSSCNAQITVNAVPVTPTPVVTPTPATYTCGSSCTTDAQCQTANASYVCDANLGNICRMDSNRGEPNCQPPVQTYACDSSCSTNAQCQSANQNYVCDSSTSHCRLGSNPTASNCQPVTIVVVPPAIGCNQACSTNADCASINHICVQTSDGLKCRLANYVNSDTCTAPGTTSVTTIAAAPAQPQKPAVLPTTGSTDTTIHFLLMGAGAVILGALGLLLL